MVLFAVKPVRSMPERFVSMRACLKALYKYHLPSFLMPNQQRRSTDSSGIEGSSHLLGDLVIFALGDDGEQSLAADVERLGERVQRRNAE